MPIVEPVSNCAGNKLLESIKELGLKLYAGDHTLDLGGCAGCLDDDPVTAVSPDAIYPWQTRDAEVRHEPVFAEQYLPQCREQFDLIMNDMKLDARDSVRLMVAYADQLPAHKAALMMLKLHDEQQLWVMDHTYRLLRPTYKIMQIQQLVHKRREVILLLRRK